MPSGTSIRSHTFLMCFIGFSHFSIPALYPFNFRNPLHFVYRQLCDFSNLLIIIYLRLQHPQHRFHLSLLIPLLSSDLNAMLSCAAHISVVHNPTKTFQFDFLIL